MSLTLAQLNELVKEHNVKPEEIKINLLHYNEKDDEEEITGASKIALKVSIYEENVDPEKSITIELS